MLAVTLPITVLAGGVPADTPPDDAAIERILLEGEIVEMTPIGSGSSRPMKLELELDGATRTAAFKTIDVFKPGVTRFERAGTEFNFRDSYRFERAAYLVDRMLGLHMVPVAVLRAIRSERGAVVDWVADAIGEGERVERGLMPPDRMRLVLQRARMDLFDALIGNVDRNVGNQLWTIADWELHLIDHSRSFRTSKKLTEAFTRSRARLSRELFGALRALDRESLNAELEELLDSAQIKALLARRDRILAKIARDREAFGDEQVFVGGDGSASE
jgi:hypothetical protein